MLKKRFLWLLLLAAFVLSANVLQAAEEAKAPAGPEKVIIYSGDKFKVELDGRIQLNMVQNQYAELNGAYGVWVVNQKWGFEIKGIGAATFPYPYISPIPGLVSAWLPWQAAIKRGNLMFDVRASELGLTVHGPGILGGYSFARVSIDFYGGFGATSAGQNGVSRQPVPRLTNAYAGLGWKTDMFQAKVTFGQYFSLVMPTLAWPVCLSYLPFFEKGVLFDFDQGILLSFVFGNDKFNVTVDGDIARAKSGNDNNLGLYQGEGTTYTNLYTGLTTMLLDNAGAGEATMRPAWHARVGVNINPDPLFKLFVAVQGHYYTERARLLTGIMDPFVTLLGATFEETGGLFIKAEDIASKSLGVQAKISVWIFTIQGAGWIGQNMTNFLAGFDAGFRPSLSKPWQLVPDKGKGGYAQFIVVGPKVGIPIVLFVGMGQEVKNDMNRMGPTFPAYSPVLTAVTGLPFNGPNAAYAASALNVTGGASSTIITNSEVGGGLWLFFSQYMKLGYEFGQDVTKYKSVPGTSTSQYHRLSCVYTF